MPPAGRSTLRDHITTVLPPISERLPSDAQTLAKESPLNPETIDRLSPHQRWAKFNDLFYQRSCNLRAVGVDSARRTRFPSTRDAPSPAVPIPADRDDPVNPQRHPIGHQAPSDPQMRRKYLQGRIDRQERSQFPETAVKGTPSSITCYRCRATLPISLWSVSRHPPFLALD